MSRYGKMLPLERNLDFQQLQDKQLREIAGNLEKKNSHKKYELLEELVYRKDRETPKFVVLEAMINHVTKVYHDDMAYCGFEKMLTGINSNYWLPA